MMRLRFIVAYIALAWCLVPGGASAQITLPTARAGSACSFGSLQFGAIGMPNIAATDIPGPQGNEIRQVYRVFYVAEDRGNRSVGFAGWLASSFDGRYGFATPGTPSSQDSLHLFILQVEPTNPELLPLASWVRALVAKTRQSPSPTTDALLRARIVGTALSPCFDKPWDGKAE